MEADMLARNPARLVLMMAGALTLTACGSVGGSSHDDIDPAAVQDTMYVDTRTRAQEVYDRIHGSHVEQAAAQYIISYQLNHNVEICMREQGYSWTAELGKVPLLHAPRPIGCASPGARSSEKMQC